MNVDSINIKAIKATNLRVDASYHLSEGQEVKRIINSCPYEMLTIKDVSSDIFIGGRAKRVYVTKKEHGIPFLSSSDILQADLENVKLASKKYTPNLEQMKLKKGWTLITRSGTIGNCAFANAKHAQKLASEHVIRVNPNNILRQGLIYAYLTSKYGHSLLTQGTFGAVIQHIEPAFVGSLPIPNFPESFQVEVDNLIQESAVLREKSADFLNKAVTTFDNVIGNPNFCFESTNERISISQITNRFYRFDAQYQIAKERLTSQIHETVNSTIKLKELATKIFIGNRGKRLYVKEQGIPFLSSSDMMLFNAIFYAKKISKKTPCLKEMIVSYGDILISRSGTVGNTIIVGNSYNGTAVSEHAMRLVIDKHKIEPEYIFAYLQSMHGQSVLKSLPYGSVIITLGETYLGDIDIPIINKDLKFSIISDVRQYISSLDKAIELENRAISMVEAEIEKWNKH